MLRILWDLWSMIFEGFTFLADFLGTEFTIDFFGFSFTSSYFVLMFSTATISIIIFNIVRKWIL